MKVQPLYRTDNYTNRPTFNGIHVLNPNVQKLILTTLDVKELNALSEFVKKEQSNSVHILLDSKDGKRLNASLVCFYRLSDFKTKYNQIPLVESKFHFIKRVVGAAERYKKQIQNFDVLKLKWDYPMLSEWVSRMYSSNT